MSIFDREGGVEKLERAETDIIEVESDFNRVYDDLQNLLKEIEHDSIELHVALQDFFEDNKKVMDDISPKTFFSKPVKDIIPIITKRLDTLSEVSEKLGSKEKKFIEREKEEWEKIHKITEDYLVNSGQELMEKEWNSIQHPLHQIAQCIHDENEMIINKYEPEVKRIMGDIQGAKHIESFLKNSKQTIEKLQKEIEALER